MYMLSIYSEEDGIPFDGRLLGSSVLFCLSLCFFVSHPAAFIVQTLTPSSCASLSPLQLGGCGILGVGVWLSVTQGNFATLSSSLPSLSAANLLIAVGAIIMVIGCLGCVGAVKESRPLLLTVNHFEGGVLDLDTPPRWRRRGAMPSY